MLCRSNSIFTSWIRLEFLELTKLGWHNRLSAFLDFVNFLPKCHTQDEDPIRTWDALCLWTENDMTEFRFKMQRSTFSIDQFWCIDLSKRVSCQKSVNTRHQICQWKPVRSSLKSFGGKSSRCGIRGNVYATAKFAEERHKFKKNQMMNVRQTGIKR